MAARYFLNIGTDWNDTANWSDTSGGSGGFSLPTLTDDVYLDANSGDLNINVLSNCLTFIHTGYTGTLTFLAQLNVYGDVTLSATATYTSSSTYFMSIYDSATLTSNGVTWPVKFQTAGASDTFTFADDWTFTQLVQFATTTVATANGSNLYFQSDFYPTTAVKGTTNFYFTGTGTWTGGGVVGCNVTINTAGTLTFWNSTVQMGPHTFTYIAGTVITGTSTVYTLGNCSIDSDGITWYNIYTGQGVATTTLLSDLHVSNNWGSSNNGNVINGYTIYVGGGMTCGNAGMSPGTSEIILQGSGVWNAPAGNNVTINTTGIIQLGPVVGVGSKNLTYIQGTVDAYSLKSTFYVGSSTFTDCDKINFYNFNVGGNFNPLTDLYIYGSFSTYNNYTWPCGFIKLYVYGSFSQGNYLGGNQEIVLCGSGNFSQDVTSTLVCSITINTPGTYKVTDGMRIRTPIGDGFKYIKGNFDVNKQTLYIASGCTLTNIHKISFYNIVISAGITVTLNEFFSGSPSHPCTIQCLTPTSTYFVKMTGDFEKLSKFTEVKNAIFYNSASLPSMNVFSITPNANKSSKGGMRVGNQHPNGFAKNNFFNDTKTTFLTEKLLTDPMIN